MNQDPSDEYHARGTFSRKDETPENLAIFNCFAFNNNRLAMLSQLSR